MMRRWRLSSPDLSCWIETDYRIMPQEFYDTANRLNAKIYPAIEVIIFNNKEDILVFRLTTGV